MAMRKTGEPPNQKKTQRLSSRRIVRKPGTRKPSGGSGSSAGENVVRRTTGQTRYLQPAKKKARKTAPGKRR
jgi:hypothetical protein